MVKKTIPGFGHFKNPNYLNLCFDVREGIVVLNNKKDDNTVSALIDLIKVSENEKVEYTELIDFEALDKFIKSFIQKVKSMPRCVIVVKELSSLTPAEQIFIDMMQAHGIPTSGIGMLTDMESLKVNGRNNIKAKYDGYFYDKWLYAEKAFLIA